MKVLLVDDEQRLASTLSRGLRAEGCVVVTACNGDDGLWHAIEDEFDVIVLDIMLPGMSGYEVLRRIREKDVWTPVLMLTAKDGDYDQTDAFDLGADDYLTKPFSFIVLVARLRALVRRGAPQRPAVLTAGSLLLDPSRRVVERANTPDSVDPQGIRVTRIPDAQQGQSRQQGRDPAERVGHPLQRTRQRHRGVCRLRAPQD